MTASNEISSPTIPDGGPGSNGDSSSTIERFTLRGRSLVLDTRVHAYRSDIADVALAGQLFAPHYARPLIRRAGPGARVLFAKPTEDSEQVAELAPGDEFAMLDVAGGWAWGYRRKDHLVGYVPADLLDAA